jgi:hypothetical protein
VFDIQTTATIIERKAHAAPVTFLLFARSTAFPAVRSVHEAVPSWLDPQYDPSLGAGAEGRVGIGSGMGMCDMFDMSPDRPKTRSSGNVNGVSGKSNSSSSGKSSGAGHLLLFSAGNYTATAEAKVIAEAYSD